MSSRRTKKRRDLFADDLPDDVSNTIFDVSPITVLEKAPSREVEQIFPEKTQEKVKKNLFFEDDENKVQNIVEKASVAVTDGSIFIPSPFDIEKAKSVHSKIALKSLLDVEEYCGKWTEAINKISNVGPPKFTNVDPIPNYAIADSIKNIFLQKKLKESYIKELELNISVLEDDIKNKYEEKRLSESIALLKNELSGYIDNYNEINNYNNTIRSHIANEQASIKSQSIEIEQSLQTIESELSKSFEPKIIEFFQSQAPFETQLQDLKNHTLQIQNQVSALIFENKSLNSSIDPDISSQYAQISQTLKQKKSDTLVSFKNAVNDRIMRSFGPLNSFSFQQAINTIKSIVNSEYGKALQ